MAVHDTFSDKGPPGPGPTRRLAVGAIPLPLWAKDYAGLGLIALLLYGAINFYANDPYYLQIICTIGVAIIIATGLNLIVGYIGQVVLGHAGFVALGGYATGLLLGRVTGKTNFIDYLYVRKLAGYDADEQRDPVRATAARQAALDSTNSLVLTLTIIVAALTIVLGAFLYRRWRQVRASGGVAQPHFWNHTATLRLVTRGLLAVGAAGGLVLYLLTAISQSGNAPGKPVTGLPWVLFAVWALSFVVLYYLANRARVRTSQDSGRLRVSFWDRPATVRLMLLLAVIGGGLLVALGLVLYLVGFWMLQNFWAVLLLGAGVTAVFGYVLAQPALRVKGPYLSMVTIAFGTIVYEVVNSSTLQPLLGSQGGSSRIPYPMTARDPKSDLIYPSLDKGVHDLEFYWTAMIIATFALLAVYVVRSFIRTRWGRSLIAIRENDIGAASVGINVTRSKTLAFVISSTVAGIGGVLLTYSFSSIDPSFSLLSVSVAYVTMLILGGAGTLYGPVLGAILITIIPEFLKNIGKSKSENFVFGLDGLNGYLTPLVLLGLVIAFLVAVRVLRNPRLANYLALAAGLLVILNSFEIFKSLTNALGSINGIGFTKVSFDASDWLIILFYYVMIAAGLAITTARLRKIALRLIAAAFIIFIPSFFRLGEGFVQNSAAANFSAVTTLLTMYGAILLYFLYLVPKGIGGLLGGLIDRFFPTSHKILQRRIQATPADGSVQIPGQMVDWQKIFNIGLTLVTIVLLQLFFTRTMLGKSVRAVAFNPTAAGYDWV